jgi:FtsH-binding integral membrane protein
MKRGTIKALFGAFIAVSVLVMGLIFYVLNWNGYSKLFIISAIITFATSIYYIQTKKKAESKI